MDSGTIAGLAIAGVLIAGLGYGCSTAFDDGSFIDPTTTWFKADQVSRMESAGSDLRVYEFTPQTEPDKKCIYVSGDREGSLQCFPKGQANDRSR